MLLLSLVQTGWAFCGTYTGPLGSSLENYASRVIIARDGDYTALTLAADVSGDATDFGMVIPVPEVLTAEDVSLVDPADFNAMDAYTAPRMVSYTCDDFLRDEYDYASSADSGAAGGGEDANGVTVEAAFEVGSYDIAVLSATGEEGLLAWLDSNGFTMPEGAGPILSDYIDGGYYFLAARVQMEELPGGAFLAPLQLRYEAATFSLPIRIGTSVSAGEQEVIIHVLNPSADGSAGIANYAEATVEDECMFPPEAVGYGAWYEDQLAAAFDEGVWVKEYAWAIGSCDPCSSDPPGESTLQALGVRWDSYDTYVTRIRARFTPDEATQDLVIYPSNIQESEQIRYILYKHELETYLPVCGVGMIEDDPGTCEEDASGADSGTAEDFDDEVKAGAGCGCATGAGASGFIAVSLAGSLLIGSRRRRR